MKGSSLFLDDSWGKKFYKFFLNPDSMAANHYPAFIDLLVKNQPEQKKTRITL